MKNIDKLETDYNFCYSKLSLYFITVLPRLKEQCGTRAVPLEDILAEKGFNKILDFVGNLDSIADLKVQLIYCLILIKQHCQDM